MKWVLTLLAALTLALVPGLVLAPAGAHAQQATIDAAAIARPAVVRITYNFRSVDENGDAALYTALGSGMILDQRGYIVTNNHVVEDAQGPMRVDLPDGRRFSANLVGRDAYTDIAVIKIPAGNLPSVTFADSSAVRPGQHAIAIGYSPDIEDPTAGRHGEVVGLDGETMVYGGTIFRGLIRTNIAIYPGDSGGALIDDQGRVIGMNVLRRREVRNGPWTDFLHIPSNRVVTIANLLIANGQISRPFLGVVVVANSRSLAEDYQLPAVPGVIVMQLTPNGPAMQGGVLEGDIITSVNGEPVTSVEDLSLAIDLLVPGQEVPVTVVHRDGSRGTLQVIIGERSQ